AQPLRGLLYLDLRIHNLRDESQRLPYRNLKARSGIDDLAKSVLGYRSVDENAHSIANKAEIACRVQGTEPDFSRTSRDLSDDGGNHGASRLPWTIGVEGAKDDDWAAKRPVEGERHLIGCNLRRRIWRLRLDRMVLVDGDVTGSSVNLARGSAN